MTEALGQAVQPDETHEVPISRTFPAPSHTDPDKSYEVHLREDGTMDCTCPAYTYFRGEEADRTCKHIRTIVEGEDEHADTD